MSLEKLARRYETKPTLDEVRGHLASLVDKYILVAFRYNFGDGSATSSVSGTVSLGTQNEYNLMAMMTDGPPGTDHEIVQAIDIDQQIASMRPKSMDPNWQRTDPKNDASAVEVYVYDA